MGMSAASFRSGDIYRGRGRDTAETANSGMAETQGANPAPQMLGAANTGAGYMEGNPAHIMAAILILFFVLRWISIMSSEDDYSGPIVPSFLNVIIVSLASMVGMTVFKLFAIKTMPENSAARKFILAA